MCESVTETLNQMNVCLGMSVYCVLGQGEFGTVLGICNKGDVASKKMALKITVDSSHSREEVEMQKLFHSIGYAPEIHDVTHSEGNTFILMDHIDMTLGQYLSKFKDVTTKAELEIIFGEIDSAIDKMYDSMLSHGDMHVENIAVILSDDSIFNGISFIDFGFSTVTTNQHLITKELLTLREYLQLLRSADKYSENVKQIVMRRLNRPDMAEIMRIFQAGPDIDKNNKTQDETLEVVIEFFNEHAI